LGARRRRRSSTPRNEPTPAPSIPADEDRTRTLRLVAEWRFPGDSKARQKFCAQHRGPFQPNDPRSWILTGHRGYEKQGALVLTPEEASRLHIARRVEWLLTASNREAWAAPMPPGNDDGGWSIDTQEGTAWYVSHVLAPRVRELARQSKALIARGQWNEARVPWLEAEREADHADSMWRELADRARMQKLASYRRGRKPGSLDALDRVLMGILRAGRRLPSKDVLAALRKRAGTGAIAAMTRGSLRPSVRDQRRNVGDVIVWRRENGSEQRTAWSSVRDRRLPRLRKLRQP